MIPASPAAAVLAAAVLVLAVVGLATLLGVGVAYAVTRL